MTCRIREGVFVAGVLLALGLAAASAALAETTLERARAQGFIRIGFANEAPYAYTARSGELTGEAAVIARHVMARLGVPAIEGVAVAFDELIAGLEAGRFDIIAAGMFITPGRCARVDFSEPSFRIAQSLLVPAGNPLGLEDYAGIAADPDLRLAVLAGAVEADYARAAGVGEEQLVMLPDPRALLRAVETGEAHAAGLTTLSISALADASAAVQMTPPFTHAGSLPVVGYGAFAFRQDDDELRRAFDRELRVLIGTERHRELVWEFGFGRDFMLPDKTTAELCAG